MYFIVSLLPGIIKLSNFMSATAGSMVQPTNIPRAILLPKLAV